MDGEAGDRGRWVSEGVIAVELRRGTVIATVHLLCSLPNQPPPS